MAIRQQSLERVASLCRNTILSKIWAGAAYGVRAYVYQDSTIADMELSTPQCLLLGLLHSLATEDIMSCCVLADICHQVQQLRSDHLRVWLSGDFVFPRQDIEKAVALFAKLLKTGALKLPSHVIRIMSSLAAKYGVDDAQLVSPFMEGRDDLANRLEEAVVNNSPGDIIALASEGADVNRLTRSGDSLLHLAVRTGNTASVAALCFLKSYLKVMNSSNATPLEEAIKNDCGTSIKTLILGGAKVGKRFLRGDTYLHLTAAEGLNGAMEALLETGMEVNIKNHLGETPLVRAVKAGNVQGVEILLEKGADAKIIPKDGKSLIEIAVESQNVELFKVLVKGGSNFVSEDGDTLIHLVAHSGNFEMLQVIKQLKQPNIKNKNGFTPLHVVSDPFVLQNLIKMGLDVNDKTNKGETALFLASEKGSLDLVRTLVQEDAALDIQDENGISALTVALKNSKEDIAIFLLHNGADSMIKDKAGRTPLHYAAEAGCIRSVTTLLDAGAEVNDKDNKGDTPVMVAAVNGKLNVVQLLVESGADLNLEDGNGDGILHHAARSGNVEVMTALLQAGVAVDLRNQYQFTALHSAACKGHTTVVTALLDHGADLEAKSGLGNTPLTLASGHGHLAVVKLLVDRGSLINEVGEGRTALGWAINNNHTAIADYLKSKGAV